MDSGLEKVLTVVSVLAAIALLVLIFYLAWNLFVKGNGEGSSGGILSGLFNNETTDTPASPTPDEVTPTNNLIKVPATPSPSPSPAPIGSELKEVPRVIGLTREDAEESLKKQSPYFQITYVEEFNDEYAKDLICAQYPGEHSMVPEDKVIQLTLSVGPEMKELIDVKGRDSYSAKTLLENNDPNDDLRKTIMPSANRYKIKDIMEACDYFFEKTGRRVTFEYSLMSGVNDSAECARELSELVKGKNCHINLIPVNPVKERDFKRSGISTEYCILLRLREI